MKTIKFSPINHSVCAERKNRILVTSGDINPIGSNKRSDRSFICVFYYFFCATPQPAMDLLNTFNDPKLCDLCIQYTCLTLVTDGTTTEGDSKKRKRIGSEGCETTVLKEVYVSKAVLASRSEYFRNMFTSGFSESGKNKVCVNSCPSIELTRHAGSNFCRPR